MKKLIYVILFFFKCACISFLGDVPLLAYLTEYFHESEIRAFIFSLDSETLESQKKKMKNV